MCRKLVIFLVAILAGVILLKKTQVGSLLTVWWNETKAEMEKKVDPETRIKQLKVEISKIDAEIQKYANKQTEQEVDCERFRKQVEAQREKVAKERSTLAAMVDALDSNSNFVTVKGEKLTQEEVQNKLDVQRKAYERDRDSLKNREAMLKTREETIRVSDQRIEAIRTRRDQLKQLVADLELSLEQLKLKQLENAIVVDNSQVSKCEELYNDIQRRLAVESKLPEVYSRYGITTPNATPEKPEVSREDSLKAAREALKADAAGQK
jgi:chromosome segregation ATPase